MSTYSTIQGSVLVSPEAATHFRTTTSWQWFDDDGATDSGCRTDGDGWVQLHFTGAPIRNLCRYLLVDLVRSQSSGLVYGTLTDDCLDGDNARTVARFIGSDHLVGAGDCLRRPVSAWPGVEVELIAPNGDNPGLVALVPGGAYPGWVGPDPVQLHGHRAVDDCGCGGYDEELDDWQCASQAGDGDA